MKKIFIVLIALIFTISLCFLFTSCKDRNVNNAESEENVIIKDGIKYISVNTINGSGNYVVGVVDPNIEEIIIPEYLETTDDGTPIHSSQVVGIKENAFANCKNLKKVIIPFKMSKIHNGAIILMHTVSKDNMVDLSKIINKLKNDGYVFKSIDRL